MIFRLLCGIACVWATLTLTAAQEARAPLRIVAIGASNTWGWGVGTRKAYPERLEDLLRAGGYDAQVTNAGVPFDTTLGMLNRIDDAVPNGTRLVILQPGGNDRRFFRSKEHRQANIDEMVKRLQARKIHVIVYDPVFPPDFYQWDQIHITSDGHARIAADLLPQVTAILRAKIR